MQLQILNSTKGKSILLNSIRDAKNDYSIVIYEKTTDFNLSASENYVDIKKLIQPFENY